MIKRLLSTTILSIALLSTTIQANAMTINDLHDEYVKASEIYNTYIDKNVQQVEIDKLDVDLIPLINLAILHGIDVTSLTYDGYTLTDTMDVDELNDYQYSQTTVQTYKDSISKAKTGIANNWSAKNIIQYADEAYQLYDNHIATYVLDDKETPEILDTLTTILRERVIFNTEIGDIAILKEILSDYTLLGLTVTTTSDGAVEALSTNWFTNTKEFRALFNGTVIDHGENFFITHIGTDTRGVDIHYDYKTKDALLIDLVDGETQIKQNDAILDGNLSLVKVIITYNGKNLDLIKLLDVQAKICLNEYNRDSLEDYDEKRNEYIRTIINTLMP